MVQIGPAVYKLLTEYHRVSDLREVPVEVETIKHVVCGYSQVDAISILSFSVQTRHILGQVQFMRQALLLPGYGEKRLEAQIYVQASLNDCWRRFVVCKEIMHCIIDPQSNRLVGTIEDLKLLAEGLVNRTLAALEDNAALDSEHMAEVMAIEALFPLELRETHEDAYNEGILTDLQLALRYKVPEEVVRSAMSPAYLKAIKQLRRDRVRLS